MSGADIQSLLKALERIEKRLDISIFNDGYIKAQNDQILRSRSTTSTDTPTGMLSRLKEAWEAWEILGAIGRVMAWIVARLIMPLLSPWIIAALATFWTLIVGGWKAVSRGWLGF